MKKLSIFLFLAINLITNIKAHNISNLDDKRYVKNELSQQSSTKKCLIKFRIPIEIADLPSGFNTLYFITNFVDQNPEKKQYVDWGGGQWTYDQHKGTDFSLWPYPWITMNQEMTYAVAAADGIIVEKIDGEYDKTCGNIDDIFQQDLTWNMVKIKHIDGTTTLYGHLKKYSITNKPIGSTVRKGEFLGYIGSSGYSEAPHLHFEVEKNGKTIDPYKESLWEQTQPYLNPEVIGNVVHYNFPKVHPSTFGGIDNIPDWAEKNKKCNENENIKNYKYFKSGEQIWVTSYIANQTPNLKLHNTIRKVEGDTLFYWNPSTVNVPQRNRYFWGWAWASGNPNESGWYYYETSLGNQSIVKSYFHVQYRQLLGLKTLDYQPSGDYFLNNTPENRNFKTGQEIYFTGYFQNPKVGDRIRFKIYKPNGTLYKKWEGLIENKDWKFWSEAIVLKDASFGNEEWYFEAQYGMEEPDFIAFTVSNKTNKIISKNDLNKDIFAMFPNPVTETTRLKLLEKLDQNANIIIQDITGKEVYKKLYTLDNKLEEITIDLSFLKNNLYFLTIKGNNDNNTLFKRKFIKK
ncbi:peptidoglycan DD-metalloendopeptidase family protein [Aquimarina longa]|uniref:peptidoglycan DD-metalloendopeptidase family protein n=1 Tax=Aquimarina longa TaxID=1080221 RepID=UPI000781DDBA|nr:peptidoglycan DD-metalloendopeptidase family protein [Aquimarina longa]